jgi:hypothetical protein
MGDSWPIPTCAGGHADRSGSSGDPSSAFDQGRPLVFDLGTGAPPGHGWASLRVLRDDHFRRLVQYLLTHCQILLSQD